MRLTLIPFNPVIGDLSGNADRILADAQSAAEFGSDLIVFPELALTAYPPRDLLLRKDFLDAVDETVASLARRLAATTIILGAPRRANGRLYNSALLLRNGTVEFTYDKRLLPNYDVFDEPRYFSPGSGPSVFQHAGSRVGLAICEDLWRAQDAPGAPTYHGLPDPIDSLANEKPDLILCLSASPFVLKKDRKQQHILEAAAERLSAPVLSINQLGANDDLIFDGAAHLAAPNAPCLSTPRFTARPITLDTNTAPDPSTWSSAQPADTTPALWQAFTLGLRDYVTKSGFSGVTLGLSGGIDSALVAAIATAALGPENVTAITMPSRHSSDGSRTDAREQADRTGITLLEIPIETAHAACETLLADPFDSITNASNTHGIAEENIQARLRGLIVMAVSNKAALIALATGNKSELAVGYCTLYGDMNGGLAPIADLYKTQVYELATWINANHAQAGFKAPPIPENVITKEPSAELRPDQRDQDTLPPYDQLDLALEHLIEQRLSIEETIGRTHLDSDIVTQAARLISSAEHKRRQLTTPLKVTRTAFGPGRRVPIVKNSEFQPSAQTPQKNA